MITIQLYDVSELTLFSLKVITFPEKKKCIVSARLLWKEYHLNSCLCTNSLQTVINIAYVHIMIVYHATKISVYGSALSVSSKMRSEQYCEVL